eukprot:1346374-Amorphochlora_amoeboformis.AAC.1
MGAQERESQGKCRYVFERFSKDFREILERFLKVLERFSRDFREVLERLPRGSREVSRGSREVNRGSRDVSRCSRGYERPREVKRG